MYLITYKQIRPQIGKVTYIIQIHIKSISIIFVNIKLYWKYFLHSFDQVLLIITIVTFLLFLNSNFIVFHLLHRKSSIAFNRITAVS